MRVGSVERADDISALYVNESDIFAVIDLKLSYSYCVTERKRKYEDYKMITKLKGKRNSVVTLVSLRSHWQLRSTVTSLH